MRERGGLTFKRFPDWCEGNAGIDASGLRGVVIEDLGDDPHGLTIRSYEQFNS